MEIELTEKQAKYILGVMDGINTEKSNEIAKEIRSQRTYKVGDQFALEAELDSAYGTIFTLSVVGYDPLRMALMDVTECYAPGATEVAYEYRVTYEEMEKMTDNRFHVFRFVSG